jgi:thiol:disulfide interchange protein
MKKITGLGLAGLLGVCVLTARAESPFTVTPRVQTTNGATELRVAFAIPTNHVLYADKLSLHLTGNEPAGAFTQPAAVEIKDKFSGKPKKVFAESFEASLPLTGGRTEDLTLSVHFQGCDEANCYFPEDQTFRISPRGEVALVETPDAASAEAAPTEWRAVAAGFTVADRGSGYLNEKQFLGFLDQAQTGQAAAAATPARSGFWGVLLTMSLIVLGGVALNLTPCILPMIPINLAIIGAGAQAGSKKRGFALGATYAAGMAIAYGVLGLVVVLTGAKFGTLNSSPWFNLGIAAVFFVLALAMFDMISIDLSRFQNQSGGGSAAAKSKFIVAYTMGTVAALLAGACVAPVVISVLLQATALHAKGIMVGLLLPFLLGVGMGLPWPFAGAGLSFLPKPGKWMLRVKYGFGVLIVAFAAYYGHLAFGLFRSESAWLVRARDGATEADPARAFTAELTLALNAARADGRPVFIDFYATWCKNCSAMEHTTFAAPAVKQRLAGFHEVRLQTERPNQSPAREILDHFKVMGLPSYVVLKPDPAAPPGAVAAAAPR